MQDHCTISQVIQSPPFSLVELQKATGLRVLRRLVERQKSVEESDAVLVKELIKPGVRRPIINLDSCKKKPPARLKPLLPQN